MTTTHTWIFLAVAFSCSKEPASLRSVIGAADYLDHAIPTREELQTSLGWLIARSLIEKSGDRYSLSTAGKKFYAEASAASAYVHKMRPRMEEDFAKLDAESETELIADDQFQAALELYYGKS
jgi:hypothetical protein